MLCKLEVGVGMSGILSSFINHKQLCVTLVCSSGTTRTLDTISEAVLKLDSSNSMTWM